MEPRCQIPGVMPSCNMENTGGLSASALCLNRDGKAAPEMIFLGFCVCFFHF